MRRILTWLGDRISPQRGGFSASFEQASPRVNPAPPRPRPASRAAATVAAPVENPGSRSRFVREDSGTHETLKIMNDSILEAEDEQAFDPYNTGRFDRSRTWNVRARK